MGWVIGLLQMKQYGPKLARYSAVVAMLIAAAVMIACLNLPRSHWAFGSEGGGDGFGILGQLMKAALVFVAALIALIIAEFMHSAHERRARVEQGE